MMKIGRPFLIALSVPVILLAANYGVAWGNRGLNGTFLWSMFVMQFIAMAVVWGGARWGMLGGAEED